MTILPEKVANAIASLGMKQISLDECYKICKEFLKHRYSLNMGQVEMCWKQGMKSHFNIKEIFIESDKWACFAYNIILV